MFKWIKEWWENKKAVIEDIVLPKLDLLTAPLADLLIARGVPSAVAGPAAKEIIEFVKTYLKRQL